MTQPKFRQIRRAVYQLKRQFGQAITLCRTISNATDLETGAQTETLIKVEILRAVIMPNRGQRAFNYDRAYIAANRNFTYGGFWDHRSRRIMMDRREIPADFPIDLDAHLVFKGKRLEVKEVFEYEDAECVVWVVDSLDGAVVMDVHDVSMTETIVLKDTPTTS